MKRAVIVASARSYRTPDFLKAASLLRMDIVVATDGLPPVTTEGQIQIDLSDPKAAGRVIAALDPKPEAVVAVDDQGVLVAAEAAAALGLAHNDPQAVSATRDKLKMRELLDIAAVPQPTYRAAGPGEVAASSAEIGYPVVIKPRGLSASRGVIRADDGTSAGLAENRIRKILDRAGRYPEARLLVEEFVPGEEVAVEGLLIDGELEVLAVIDKPDPSRWTLLRGDALHHTFQACASDTTGGRRHCREGSRSSGTPQRPYSCRNSNRRRPRSGTHRSRGPFHWRFVRPGVLLRASPRITRGPDPSQRPGSAHDRHDTVEARDRCAHAPDTGDRDPHRC